VDVRKTYKLYIGGQFPRSESGHSYVVDDVRGRFVANAALASRKDARDAVLAARAAFSGWSGKTAYNRAQILYRVAEIMEDRRPQFTEAVRQSEGLTPTQAGKVLDLSIDRLVWYAGWADKVAQVAATPTPSRDRSSTSRHPSRPAWWRWSPPSSRACWGWSRSSRPWS
jgi:acyl-CoA reductase-like NAD-dependent aldehyde dehydrogenase